MTTTKDDGGPAFPTQQKTGICFAGDDGIMRAETLQQGGMTLRDWFAGQALIGLFSAGEPTAGDDLAVQFSEAAYLTADAMIEARK